MARAMTLQSNNAVRVAVLCDGAGEVLDARGDASDSESLAATAAFSVTLLAEAGQALGFGLLERVITQAKRTTSLSLYQNSLLATAEWEGPQPMQQVEKLLQSLVAGHLTGMSPLKAVDTSWADEAVLVSKATVEAAALRRAFAFGDLDGARTTAEKLAEASRPVSATLLLGLESAIGAVQAGNKLQGISELKLWAQSSEVDASLRWVAHLWMARAALDCHRTDDAIAFVEKSVVLAAQLDDRAVALSRCVQARIELSIGDAANALTILADARAPLQEGRDGPELAESWLVEANVLATLNRDHDCEMATSKAHGAYRRWWAPTLFATRRALASDRLDEATRLVEQLRGLGTPPAMLAREERLLAQVRDGVIPSQVATRLSLLQNGSPSSAAVAELGSLATRYPKCLALREAFAWGLYRAGDMAQSKRQFEKLAELSLAPDERASVALGLACLATRSSEATTQAGRVRAAVSAIPPRLRSETPAPSPDVASSSWPEVSMSSLQADPALALAPIRAETSSAFAGEIGMFSVPELLEFLHAGRRSGTLVCSSVEGIGAVSLRDGNITGAASPNGDTLGALLVQSGKLSKAQIGEALSSQGGDANSPLLGEILVRQGVVDRATVREALVSQILSCLREMIRWATGQFTFDPTAEGQIVSPEVAVDLNPQAALLEIFRVQDEESIELTEDNFI